MLSHVVTNAKSFLGKPVAGIIVFMSDSFKTGVKCKICLQILHDKSTFNRHHTSAHLSDPMQYENVTYKQEGGVIHCGFDWNHCPLPNAAPLAGTVAPGLLERETGILSKGVKLFSASKWAAIREPPIETRDAAVELLDEIDDFALVASTMLRSQVNRTWNGLLKSQSFRPLKDNTGGGLGFSTQYADVGNQETNDNDLARIQMT